MNTSYTFTIIRYVHDKVTGEFVNVGVILHCPAAGFLRAKCSTSNARLRRMFGRIDSDHIRDFLRYIERQVNRLDQSPGTTLMFSDAKENAATYAARILPPDDSALQLSPVAGGVTTDPAQELDAIFERYVNRYVHGKPKTTRQDEDVLPAFRKPLEERRLTTHVQPKVIVAPDYEHEFPLAWQNGVWNTCDAVSFDLMDSSDIIEKANKWLGRAKNLFESPEKFRLVLLVGEPRRPELFEAASTAEKILRKADGGEVVVIREKEAQRLAEMVERDVAH